MEASAESTAGVDEDPSSSDKACAAAGGAFGVLAETSLHTLLPEDIHLTTQRGPGLVAGPDGLFVSLAGSEDPDEQDPPGFSAHVSFDGEPLGPTTSIDTPWVGGRWWPGTDTTLVTHCRDRELGWSWVNAEGTETAPTASPPGSPPCNDAPAAAWTTDNTALVAWLERTEDCTEGSTCARVMQVEPGGAGTVHNLFDAHDPGPGTTVSVAAGPNGALAAMLRFERVASVAMVDLATVALDHDGTPRSEPRVQPLAPDGDDSLTFREARAVADGEDGFFVFVGGWGGSVGRLHLDRDGNVLEPLTALPPVEYGGVSQEFLHFDRVVPRPDGALAIHWAAQGGAVHPMLSTFDPDGNFVDHVVFPLAGEVSVATDGTRTWALGRNFRLYELGCVLP